MTKPKFRFEKPIVKSKTEPANKNVLWYFSLLKKGLTINTIKEYVKALGWVDLFDTAPIELGEVTFTENGIYENNENGWNKVMVDVPPIELSSTTFTENGLYTNPDGGWNEVNVDIPLKDTRTEYFMSYTTNNDYTVTPLLNDVFILSNIYDNGVGIIIFNSPVTSISQEAFRNCSSLTSLTIPNSVTEIGHYAFENCPSLTSITIPNSIASIGNGAFYYCSSLTSVAIPNSITSIGSLVFSHCASLASITIPESITSIAFEAFYLCTSLDSIYIEAFTPPKLGEQAFTNTPSPICHIPYGTKTSYESSDWAQYVSGFFEGECSPTLQILYTSTNGNIVTPYRTNLLNKANIVSNDYIEGQGIITFDRPLTVLGQYTFYKCSTLSSIIIPNRVTSIDGYAFQYCTALTSITIPNSVTYIGQYAFEGCSSLTSLTIPESVTTMGGGGGIFDKCSALTSIVVDKGNTAYDSRENCNAIINTKSNILIVGCQNTVIPNSVTGIGTQSFSGRHSLTSITIPDSVTSIGSSAFYSCSSLTSITIPNGVKSIGRMAFDGCSALTSITCEATTPPTLSSENNLSNVTAVYVPAESVDAYKTATNWSYYSGIIQPIQ